ncbi:putative bifunctional diguanylate cyclase/phosphodiesterase [Devosia sp.]|jgi:diguanylate cyclase (GGDEF)-like protein/PAS domain S-box-containing protein|uniref:putative bifunctional diguanylate cyclase/phosphodiesterase n=1 Tax=Devosia sp. TaxID=1871048 RepID=UPI003EEAEE7D
MNTQSGSGLLSLVNGFVDRAIGAADLPTAVRQKLLRQQLNSVSKMTPAMLASTVVVSVVFLLLTWGTARFWPMAVTLAAINMLQLHASYLAWSNPNLSLESKPHKSVVRTVLYALLLGTLWGVVFNIIPVDLNSTVRGAATIGAGGLLCISMMALVNYPQALAAFTIPLIVGALGTVVGMDSTPDVWVQGVLLMAFTSIMVGITFNHASAFVAHRASEALLLEKREIIGLLLREFEQAASDWVWGFDADGSINRLSSGFTTATGVDEDDLVGADFVHFMQCITPPNDTLVAQLERDVSDRKTFQDIELRVTAAGVECWWALTGKPAFDDAGVYLGYIGTGSDVTARKLAERRITMLAHHDPMTGLLNRNKFTEQLNSCVARLERYGAPFTVMFLDLDQFKSVNDSRGHMVGDRLLVEVAKRIDALVHEPDLTARLGGDEFAIILPNSGDSEMVARLADRLIAEIKRPFIIEGEEVVIGMSVGIAMAPLSGTRPDQILRNADLALYQAKDDGRSVYRFFESQMDSDARERRLLEVELRDAIGNRELVLYYQPLVSAESEEPVGFEALIRWNHPIRGLVPPVEFIPVAEHSNLIVDIGDWTIEQACMAASTWPEHLTVAVNLSAKHFRRSDITQVVQKALAMSGLAPKRLEIEITEGLLMEDPEEVVAKLGELRALGVSIAMDDFGTGYSSLNYLLKFPFDKIKIDRSFVNASSGDEVARDILKAIASLGRTLKLKITAEGVETREQASFLTEIACDQLQGFFFARPLDPVELPHYLLTRFPGRAEAVTSEAQARLAAIAS